MKNKTVKIIVILVGLLVLNIEAAHAGITHKFKIFISHELSDFQLYYILGGLLSLVSLCYIVFMPAFKSKGKITAPADYFINLNLTTYEKKKLRVKKISEILKNIAVSEPPHP